MPTYTNSLWDFALTFYALPQVSEICLQLQDNYGANVCLLIGLHWLDSRNIMLSDQQFTQLQAHIQPWYDEAVVPLRHLRQQLKKPIGTIPYDDDQEKIRIATKQVELLAEKRLLGLIETWAIEQGSALAINNSSLSAGIDNGTNLADYIDRLNAPRSLCVLLQGH